MDLVVKRLATDSDLLRRTRGHHDIPGGEHSSPIHIFKGTHNHGSSSRKGWGLLGGARQCGNFGKSLTSQPPTTESTRRNNFPVEIVQRNIQKRLGRNQATLSKLITKNTKRLDRYTRNRRGSSNSEFVLELLNVDWLNRTDVTTQNAKKYRTLNRKTIEQPGKLKENSQITLPLFVSRVNPI